MSKIIELFGHSASSAIADWPTIVDHQECPFLGSRCYKVRKSSPELSIGTCSVLYGRVPRPIAICPSRLLERGVVFEDCIELLSEHATDNSLHIISEVSVPGGSVDYLLVSVAPDGSIADFVGIEFQTLDTTGTVWPERQRFLKENGIQVDDAEAASTKTFGMNWKMTAKTILVQMHHKLMTFEHLDKCLVLVVQDDFLDYMAREFTFDEVRASPTDGDRMRIHSYSMSLAEDGEYVIELDRRLATDSNGLSRSLGLQAEARIELGAIHEKILKKLSNETEFPSG